MKKVTALLSALVLSACTQQTTNDVQSFSLGNTEILLTTPHNMTHLTEKKMGRCTNSLNSTNKLIVEITI